jgi:hypothetical protein
MYIHPNNAIEGMMEMTPTIEQQTIDKLIMKLAEIRDNTNSNQRRDNAKAIAAACAGSIVELGDDYADEFGLDNPRSFNDINEPIQETVVIMFDDTEHEINIRRQEVA